MDKNNYKKRILSNLSIKIPKSTRSTTNTYKKRDTKLVKTTKNTRKKISSK